MHIPTRAKIRSVVQVLLTIFLTPVCVTAVMFDLGTPTAQKFAAGWVGAILGYWLK